MRRVDTSQGSRHRWQDYDKIKQDVISILEQYPEGMTGAKVAEMIGITQGAMSKYLSMLDVDGVIASRKVGVAKLWKLVSSSDRTDLLVDRLGSENVNFKDYALSLVENDNKLFDPDNKQVLVMHSIILLNLYQYTKTILGSEVHAFFHEWGKSYTRETKDLVKNVAEKTRSNFISSFLSLLKLRGWGRFDINSMNEKSIEVIWHDSIWSEAEPKENVPVDDFMVGALAEAASLSFGGSWKFAETKCRAMGSPHCRFAGSRAG